MKRAQRVKEWLDREGKTWLFRISVLGAIIFTVYSEISGTNTSTNILMTMMFGLLLVFAEIFLDGVSQIQMASQDGTIIQKGTTLSNIYQDAVHASDLTIVVRSGEATYYKISEIAQIRRDKLTVCVIFTINDQDDQTYKDYQQIWVKRWENMFRENGTKYKCHVVQTAFEPECVIIDGKIGYLNYRAPRTNPNWIKSTRLSNQGGFLIDLYFAWIEKLKATQTEN